MANEFLVVDDEQEWLDQIALGVTRAGGVTKTVLYPNQKAELTAAGLPSKAFVDGLDGNWETVMKQLKQRGITPTLVSNDAKALKAAGAAGIPTIKKSAWYDIDDMVKDIKIILSGK